jgi:Mg2+-importing ATPase
VLTTARELLGHRSFNATPLLLEVPISELVPGDIIYFYAGDIGVASPCGLLTSRDLFISQEFLTGEAISIEKYDAMRCVAYQSSEDHVSSNNELLELR